MAYSAERKALTIHVSRDDTYDTLGWIGDILSALEYTYNIAAVLNLSRQNYFDDRLHEIVGTLSHASQLGFSATNLSLREFIPLDAQSRLLTLRVVNSVDIGFDGLGEAIDATADVADPLRRRARKEANRHAAEKHQYDEVAMQEAHRHTAAMNAYAEEERRLQLEDKRTETVRARLDLLTGISMNMDKTNYEERQTQIHDYAFRELMRGGNELDKNDDVKIIDGPR
jgi:hypothetical protein